MSENAVACAEVSKPHQSCKEGSSRGCGPDMGGGASKHVFDSFSPRNEREGTNPERTKVRDNRGSIPGQALTSVGSGIAIPSSLAIPLFRPETPRRDE